MMFTIETLTDHHDCESCGGTFADGYVIHCPDGSVIERWPEAACWNSKHYTIEDACLEILHYMGVGVIVK